MQLSNQREEEKNDHWKWEGRIYRYGRNLLLQCAQKSQTPEMTGSCSNTFMGKSTFCVEEAQLKPEYGRMWYLHYHVSIRVIRDPGLKRRRVLM